MWLSQAVLTLCLLVAYTSAVDDNYMPSPNPPSPVPTQMPEPEWKAPKEYLEMRSHHIQTRDHGCAEFPQEVEKPSHCVNIWIKNRFSMANIAPSVVTLEFQYNGKKAMKAAWKPVTTWLEHVSPWRVRGCATTVGGRGMSLSGGKLRWLAVYNHTQSNTEQSGVIAWNTINRAMTTGKYCFHQNYPMAFIRTPYIKLTIKSNFGMNAMHNAMAVWVKGMTSTGNEICLSEFHNWIGYHDQFDLHWYATTNLPSEDNGSAVGEVVFPAGEVVPADHNQLNRFYCRNVTLPQGYYPCPAVMLQPVEQSLAVCESPTVAWISYWKNDTMVVCYGDQRGIRGQRKTEVKVQYIVYGVRDKCSDLTCPMNKHCVHPTYNTVKCGCWKMCPEGGSKVCGTNMKTYDNKCKLEKEACEGGDKFMYAHDGPCEMMTYDHGRVQLEAVGECGGLYCKNVSTRNNVWYPHANISVQITVNWMNSIGRMANVHDATSSWIEDVKPTGFRACVMEAGRRNLVMPPHINWFAYQGKMDHVKSQRIEVGEWQSGTHCVPLHERRPIRKPMPWMPPKCPSANLANNDKAKEDKWHYDSLLMANIYGQHHHEWFRRIMMGYGVEKLNLTSGMRLGNATLMMTVEHTDRSPISDSIKDAINVWMEYDNNTKESYICLREMQNFDGTHKGIHVHWTLFNSSTIPGVGQSHMVKFRPKRMAPMYNNYAFCETRPYLPMNFTLVGNATVLVSLMHKIASNKAKDSMKKYMSYQQEVMKGMPMMGDNNKKVMDSWMMPHMWRANLTGWRPHMRISRNTDYSAWIEGMNGTHLKVCQKSVFNGFIFDGVDVSVIVLPDRCSDGYRHVKYGKSSSLCFGYKENCANSNTAGQRCRDEGAFVACPENTRDNYIVSYISSQRPIQIAKGDQAEEGKWVRILGNPSKSNYSRWAPGRPTIDRSRNCDLQRGRPDAFTEIDVPCSNCMNYVCVKPAPQLSCNFPSHYCNGCGKCTMTAPFSFKCDCIPPFTGARCEKRMM
ncbi:uncharacterized protein LOC130623744 [Hydractinia symbiolongicarpus]|uniref:uncharacterized protein LOC130623744 n=1 Tax=Hydractinia symbiolongicarpus TaxID=13093 RepID=UPI00254C1329|nr:uncharacterized protein LOC130623744 [Hydractinia symbiolongicarpus]